jgi:ketosteroid isomerase-like protein
VVLATVFCGCAGVQTPKSSTIKAIESVLDDWHDAASKADENRYFGHMAKDAVFLGTDASERWTRDAFNAYVKPYFSKGQGWTYVPSHRHVMLSADQQLAWFDEHLTNEKYGDLRGTGVLRRTDGVWRIVHYNMVFTVPNDVAKKVVETIRTGGENPTAQ